MSLCSIRLVILIIVSSLVAACSSSGSRWDPTDYTVKSGDTLYSIAWRYELDAEEMADWNGISVNSRVKAGQRLHTREPSGYRKGDVSDRDVAYAAPDIPAGTAWIKAQRGDTLYNISQRSGVGVEQLAMLNRLDAPYTIHPDQTIFLKPLSEGTATREQQVPAANRQASTQTTHKTSHVKTPRTTSGHAAGQSAKPAVAWPGSINWQKPVQGRIVKKYDSRRNDAKGIDIAGQLGDPVHAAAPGQVVYSGDGLISYGNLVIIKHNRNFLSAYAYNQNLLVKEGDTVKTGQRIATMGKKDDSSPRLHFEIRRNGKPVDPLKYLPW